MEKGSLDRYAPLETVLNEAGFTVEDLEKQGKRTVITVSREGKSGKNTVFSVPKAGLTGSTHEEQGVNGW
jgi:hypothetical protein